MKFCPNCGHELPPGVAFCPNCGAKIVADEATDNVEPESQPQPVPNQSTENNEESPMNQIPTPSSGPNPQIEHAKVFIKKHWIPILSVAAVLIVGLGIFKYVKNQPINISGDAKVTFSGYNTKGEANYNFDKLIKDVQLKAFNKVGLSTDDGKSLLSGDEKAIAALQANPDTYAKVVESGKLIGNVSITLSKPSKLKNGQKVTLVVKDKNVKGA